MAENVVWLIIGALFLTVPLIALARRAAFSYPIVLVLAGIALGFIPGLPAVSLNPDVVLVVFLPPLLFWGALAAPVDEMRRHGWSISMLVIGLVTATTVAVAVVAHAFVPLLPWGMAFVLGAIVAPTDELASGPVLQLLRMPRSLVAIVEGESLLNDASSLILYTSAIGVVVSGVFNPYLALGSFILAAIGGIAIGTMTALTLRELWKRVTSVDLQITIFIAAPYFAYSAAERLGLSATVAAVFVGLVATRFVPVVVGPEGRLQAQGFYKTIVFLANVILFLLVGLQLHALYERVLQNNSWQSLALDALAVNAAVVFVRFAWFIGNEYLPGLPLIRSADAQPNWRRAVIAGWSGLRGAVSLAAALGIPFLTATGASVPQRDLVIFLAFSVIVFTLIGGGLTLPSVVRRIGAAESGSDEAEELRSAIRVMRSAAASYLDRLVSAGQMNADRAAMLAFRSNRRLYSHNEEPDLEETARQDREVVLQERATLIAMRDRGEIDNTVLRELQRRLDFAEVAIPQSVADRRAAID